MTPEERAIEILPWKPGEATGICSPGVLRDKIAEAIREAEQRGAEREREACAELVNGWLEPGALKDAIVAAIRARGDRQEE